MDLQLNADRFSGNEYVELYDKFRPSPPLDIIHQSLNYCNQSKVQRIVDLGCGTGISTRTWPDFADEVIGIEPSQAMIQVAEARNRHTNIQFKTGYAHEIPLENESADLISCSQSFHWMEPASTLNDINRVLRKDGVLVIYDVIWPPAVNTAFEYAYQDPFEQVNQLSAQFEKPLAHKWRKSKHIDQVRQSGHFSFSKEAYYHKTIPLDKEQFIGIALSQGGLEALLKRGYTEDQIGVTRFKKTIHTIEHIPYPKITYHYRVIYACK